LCRLPVDPSLELDLDRSALFRRNGSVNKFLKVSMVTLLGPFDSLGTTPIESQLDRSQEGCLSTSIEGPN
jgi:hypothetical protein